MEVSEGAGYSESVLIEITITDLGGKLPLNSVRLDL